MLHARMYTGWGGTANSAFACVIERPNDPKFSRKNETKRPIQVCAFRQKITAPRRRKASVVNRSQVNA